jgi:hypothetical protein
MPAMAAIIKCIASRDQQDAGGQSNKYIELGDSPGPNLFLQLNRKEASKHSIRDPAPLGLQVLLGEKRDQIDGPFANRNREAGMFNT